jgi:6-pyruvoyltetrahydropterin/6-carboxytetrahydropterin synthase
VNFIDEVINICFDPNVISDYKKYLPMGDETVFNYLYSKYNFSKYMSSKLCFNIPPYLPINDVQNHLEKTKNFVSYIHTKRYHTTDFSEKNFSNLKYEEYQQIFEILLSKESSDSKINILSFEKNDAVFGKCNNPNFHGHNYDMIVSVTGPIDPETGYVMDVKILSDLIKAEVEDKFDHKNLNLDVPEFLDLNPTAENIAVVIWNKIRNKIDSKFDLEVVLYETPRNFVTYKGE